MKHDFILLLCLAVSVSNLIIAVVKLMENNDSLEGLFSRQSFWPPAPVVHHVPTPIDAVNDKDMDIDEHAFISTEKSSNADREALAVGGSGLRGSDHGKDKNNNQGIKQSVVESESEIINSPATDTDYNANSKKRDGDNKKNEEMGTSYTPNVNAAFSNELVKNDNDKKYSTFPSNIHFSTDIMTKKSFTSSTYLSTNHKYVLKIMDKNTSQKKKEWLSREICMLKYLNNENEERGGVFDWAPKLVWYNESAMLTTYMGVPLDLFNIPLNYKEQYKRILSDMKSIGVEHGDIHKSFGNGKELYELMVREDNRLSLVDFGLAKLNGSYDCNGQVVSNVSKTYNFEPDRWVLKKLDRTFRRHLKVEQHFMVDWTQHYSKEEIRNTMKQWPNLVVSKMVTHPAYTDDTERKAVFAEFYGGPTDDFRGKQPFNMYFIYDTDPKYDLRLTNKGKRLVNAAMFDLKKALRTKMGGGYKIHATDNIQETKDNMVALKLPEEYRQHRFDTLQHVFDILNFSDIPYVVIRHYDVLPNNTVSGEDVDIMFSDYYEAKRILDGDTPRDLFKTHFENGKHRIQTGVHINQKVYCTLCKERESNIVQFDLRSVGDNYLDEKWQRDILERRVLYENSNIYIPSEEDNLYLHIYHAIIQKSYIAKYNAEFFMTTFKCSRAQAKNRGFLRTKLDAYFEKHGYELAKPNDRSVQYFPDAGKKEKGQIMNKE